MMNRPADSVTAAATPRALPRVGRDGYLKWIRDAYRAGSLTRCEWLSLVRQHAWRSRSPAARERSRRRVKRARSAGEGRPGASLRIIRPFGRGRRARFRDERCHFVATRPAAALGTAASHAKAHVCGAFRNGSDGGRALVRYHVEIRIRDVGPMTTAAVRAVRNM